MNMWQLEAWWLLLGVQSKRLICVPNVSILRQRLGMNTKSFMLLSGRRLLGEGDKLLFNLIQRFNADMMDLHSGNEVDLNELKMDAQDLKMHAREKYPGFLPLVTELVSEYTLYWKNNH